MAGEYAGNICATATVQVMPLLVVWRLGPAEAAYLTLPWLIASGISLVMWNVAASFVVETAGAHGHPGTLLRRSLLLWSGIVAGAMWSAWRAPARCWNWSAPSYAAHGVALLRLIGLSAPFTAAGGALRDACLAGPAGLAAGRVPGHCRDHCCSCSPWCCCRASG